MADSSVDITAGVGTPIRTLANAGVDSGSHQQVVSLADSAGVLLGTASAPLPVGPGALVLAAGSLGALNATYDGTTDVSVFASVRVQNLGTWVGTITFQTSNDGTNWQSKQLTRQDATTGATSSSNSIWSGDLNARYFRLTMSAYTSGTATPIIVYSAAPAQMPTVSLAASSGTSSAGILTTSGGTGVFYVSVASASASQVAKGSAGNLQSLLISNTSASAQWVKLYNATSITAGTTAAVVDIPIAAGATLTLNLGANGQRFGTGIVFMVTGAAGATNNTANVAGVYVALTYV